MLSSLEQVAMRYNTGLLTNSLIREGIVKIIQTIKQGLLQLLLVLRKSPIIITMVKFVMSIDYQCEYIGSIEGSPFLLKENY